MELFHWEVWPFIAFNLPQHYIVPSLPFLIFCFGVSYFDYCGHCPGPSMEVPVFSGVAFIDAISTTNDCCSQYQSHALQEWWSLWVSKTRLSVSLVQVLQHLLGDVQNIYKQAVHRTGSRCGMSITWKCEIVTWTHHNTAHSCSVHKPNIRTNHKPYIGFCCISKGSYPSPVQLSKCDFRVAQDIYSWLKLFTFAIKYSKAGSGYLR